MHVGRSTYISWWPGGQGRDFKLSRALPVYSVPHISDREFETDQEAEGGTGTVRKPDHTIQLSGLDEPRILHWWQAFSAPGNVWSTLGQNCSTTVARALMVGGGDDYAEGIVGWWRSWNTVWRPDNVLKYAEAISRGLGSAAGRWFAINFIRRFTVSPLGMTSLTWSMDERSLASALFLEHGSNAPRVEEVLRELDEHRSAESKGVARAYVGLLASGRGAAVDALKQSLSLRKQLLKTLKAGWTTSEDQNSIAFIAGLG
jgi:hypothetical protein